MLCMLVHYSYPEYRPQARKYTMPMDYGGPIGSFNAARCVMDSY